jgi:hypothetical protein
LEKLLCYQLNDWSRLKFKPTLKYEFFENYTASSDINDEVRILLNTTDITQRYNSTDQSVWIGKSQKSFVKMIKVGRHIFIQF